MEIPKTLNIKQWAVEDRPREKLIIKGPQSLSNAELLAILIGSGTREDSAVDLSMKILNTVDNNLNQLGRKNVAELKKVKGIGEARAITIMAALELGRRRRLEEAQERKVVTCSSDLFEYMHPRLADLNHEEMWVLYLNRANAVMECMKLSMGGTAGTVIDTKIILKRAIETLSSSIALCHNHPSGNRQPSKADIEVTQKLKIAAQALDFVLIDHIIVCDRTYFSFADEGKL